MTAGLDPDLMLDIPYIGFLLQSEGENVLVDNGIHQDNIKNGRAWGGYEAKGGNAYVLKALAEYGLTPGDIDAVLYTHLHNDHAGGLALFPNAKTYYQRDEYINLLHQMPGQVVRGDFDNRTPGDMKVLKNVYMFDGDVTLPNGIELYKIPGHTLGSMAVVAPTREGRFIITGDLPHMNQCLFPEQTKLQKLDGSFVDITPAPENMRPYLFNSVVYDHWAAYDSYNKLKVIADAWEPEYFLTGHDPWVILKKSWG
jgi:glyoxylase-like metal-dependent hydrolase (beta-lactamase superfamily II)